jgi:hypothetical protein
MLSSGLSHLSLVPMRQELIPFCQQGYFADIQTQVLYSSPSGFVVWAPFSVGMHFLSVRDADPCCLLPHPLPVTESSLQELHCTLVCAS